MALNGIPISDSQCIGESLPIINEAFITLDSRSTGVSGTYASNTTVTGMSAYADSKFATQTSVTGMSAYVDSKFIPKPTSASAQQVLTYNGSTSTWVASATPVGSPTGNIAAWVNFDGTGSNSVNQTIRAQSNIASVYKNASGDYTVTFTAALADANYVVSGMAQHPSSSSTACVIQLKYNVVPTTSGFTVYVTSGGSGAANSSNVHLMVVR